jgi:hypothetical protein
MAYRAEPTGHSAGWSVLSDEPAVGPCPRVVLNVTREEADPPPPPPPSSPRGGCLVGEGGGAGQKTRGE